MSARLSTEVSSWNTEASASPATPVWSMVVSFSEPRSSKITSGSA
jgi:hypothetical protein